MVIAPAPEMEARGMLCRGLADPFRPPLPFDDPFGQPCQVSPCGDQQRRRERPLRPYTVSLVAAWGAEGQPGLLGEKVTTAVRNLLQLADRGVDVERSAGRVTAGRAGESGGCDPVRVGSMPGNGHTWMIHH